MSGIRRAARPAVFSRQNSEHRFLHLERGNRPCSHNVYYGKLYLHPQTRSTVNLRLSTSILVSQLKPQPFSALSAILPLC